MIVALYIQNMPKAKLYIKHLKGMIEFIVVTLSATACIFLAAVMKNYNIFLTWIDIS
jgi:hypothetical protein